MGVSATITPTQTTLPASLTAAQLIAMMAEGWSFPVWNPQWPALITPNGGTQVLSLVGSSTTGLTCLNVQLIAANAQQNLWEVQYAYLPNGVTFTDPDSGQTYTAPAGALIFLVAQTGPSAYTPPQPPPPPPAGVPFIRAFLGIAKIAGHSIAVFALVAGQDTVTQTDPTTSLIIGETYGLYTYTGDLGTVQGPPILNVTKQFGPFGASYYYSDPLD